MAGICGKTAGIQGGSAGKRRESGAIRKGEEMAREKGYYPSTFDEQEAFSRNLTGIVIKKTIGTPAEWAHIPKEDSDKLVAVVNAFQHEYENCTAQANAADRLARREAGKAMEQFIRYFVKRYLRYAPVTDEDRAAMGLNNYDATPTPGPDVNDTVEMAITNAPTGDTHIIHYKRMGVKSKAKTPWHMAIFQAAARKRDEAPPAIDKDDDWGKDVISMDSPFRHTWPSELAGQIGYYRAHWEASNGKKGAWVMGSATIP
jgi:hypothetical protein